MKEIPVKLLRTKDVLDILNISTTSLWRLKKNPLFPRQLKLGNNIVAWIDSDIYDFINQCKEKGVETNAI